MMTRHARPRINFAYNAENRLVSVTGAATATFVYDGDSKQVKSIVNGVTTYYVGNHYEVKNGTVTKYYFAGTTRLAVRTNGTLSYLLGDHLGSSSVTTNENGIKTASALYREASRRDKAFGETRFTLGNLGTDYKFTGQREEASLGIYFFNARWYDGSLGRFLSPDTIVPTQTQGTQAWDRYAFVNNNPVRYNDPTGHGFGCDPSQHCNNDGSPQESEEVALYTYTLAGIETMSPSIFGNEWNYRPPWATPLFDTEGRAKLYPEEYEGLGIDPQTPEGAILGMQKRISSRIENCADCSDTDKFIVAALGSDYNFSATDASQASKNKEFADSGTTTINWEGYLNSWDQTGNSKAKYFDLIKTFTNNVLDLQSKGYYVPSTVNFTYILNTLLPSEIP